MAITHTLRHILWLGPPLAAIADRLCPTPRGARSIVFYDGECVLCNGVVRLLLHIGVPEGFYFASQQGHTWAQLLDATPTLRDVDSIAVLREVSDCPPVLRIRSEAVLWLLTQLRLPYALAGLALLVPLPLLDLGYRLLARYRKRILGEIAPGDCPLPPPAFRTRFLD